MPKARKSQVVSKKARAAARAPSGGAKAARRSNGRGPVYLGGASLGAAVSSRAMRVGMSDVIGHTMSWLIGYTWVGDGATLGEANKVYLADPSQSYVTTLEAGIGANTAIAAADGIWGAAYCGDVMKHYSRIRIRKQFLDLQSLVPSTANSMMVIIAGQRGGSGVGTASSGHATAGSSYTNVVSMAGATPVSSWESCRLDLTDFIAGGSGANQNEFDINAGLNNSSVQAQTSANARGIVPSTFAVSGNSTTAGLEGTAVHAVIGTWVVDLLDFIGGQAAPNPEGVTARPCVARVIRSEERKCASTERRPDEKSSGDAGGGERKSSLPPPAPDVQSGRRSAADDVRSIDGRDGMPVQPPALTRQKGYVIVDRAETGTAGRPQSAK